MSVKRGQLIKIMSSKTKDQIVFKKEVLNKELCGVMSFFFNKIFTLFYNDTDVIKPLKNKKSYKIIINSNQLICTEDDGFDDYYYDSDQSDAHIDKLVRESKIYENFRLETIHPFHILPPSPWPFFAAVGSFFLAVGAVMCMHSYFYGRIVFLFGMITTITVMFNWWRDVIREGLYEKMHNNRVQTGLALGVMLFIVSEAMLFFTFFWVFFYFSCVPTLDPEHSWPPKAIKEGSHLGMAAANTAILLATSFTITWSHNASIKGDKKFSVESLTLTIALSVLFLSIQLYEFRSYSFSISDSVYGSCFYMITGFHGFHVIVGTVGLIIALIRAVNSNFTNMNHLGVTAAIWYWHFVDVVWLFVFTTVYCWGNQST